MDKSDACHTSSSSPHTSKHNEEDDFNDMFGSDNDDGDDIGGHGNGNKVVVDVSHPPLPEHNPAQSKNVTRNKQNGNTGKDGNSNGGKVEKAKIK
eukprot:15340205-Ditylum_brightwellii.AAC.1